MPHGHALTLFYQLWQTMCQEEHSMTVLILILKTDLSNACTKMHNTWLLYSNAACACRWTAGTMLEAAIAWGLLDRFGWRVVLLVSSVPQGRLLVLPSAVLCALKFVVLLVSSVPQ
eukprot:1161762-Pelagomonas_calceolata.AAC.1